MNEAFGLMFAGAFGSDLLLVYLIGTSPALALSRKIETAAGLALSNLVVAPLAAIMSFSLIGLLPDGLGLDILSLPLMVISVIVCLFFVANVGERVWPALHAWLEPFVPLMSVNCTLLGIVLIVLVEPRGVLEVIGFSLGLAIGYGVFLLVFSQIRERLAAAAVPQAFRDAPVALLSMAILGMAMRGFG